MKYAILMKTLQHPGITIEIDVKNGNKIPREQLAYTIATEVDKHVRVAVVQPTPHMTSILPRSFRHINQFVDDPKQPCFRYTVEFYTYEGFHYHGECTGFWWPSLEVYASISCVEAAEKMIRNQNLKLLNAGSPGNGAIDGRLTSAKNREALLEKTQDWVFECCAFEPLSLECVINQLF